MIDSNKKRSAGRPKSEVESQAREQLLTAALVEFAENGIAGTRDAAVARRAGLSPAMVPYYFKSREEMLDVLFEQHVAPLIQGLWELDAEDWESCLGVLEKIAHNLVATAEQHPWLPHLWLREVLNENGRLRERVLRILPSLPFDRFHAQVRREQSEGKIAAEVVPGLVFVAAVSLTMMPLAIGLWRKLPDNQQVNNQQLEQHVVTLLRGGLYNGKNGREKSGMGGR